MGFEIRGVAGFSAQSVDHPGCEGSPKPWNRWNWMFQGLDVTISSIFHGDSWCDLLLSHHQRSKKVNKKSVKLNLNQFFKAESSHFNFLLKCFSLEKPHNRSTAIFFPALCRHLSEVGLGSMDPPQLGSWGIGSWNSCVQYLPASSNMAGWKIHEHTR